MIHKSASFNLNLIPLPCTISAEMGINLHVITLKTKNTDTIMHASAYNDRRVY